MVYPSFQGDVFVYLELGVFEGGFTKIHLA